MFFRRIDVSFEDRCVKSRSGDSRRETKELGFSLHRLADDDGTHAQARRQRAAAANISQTIAIGLALSDQAGEVADRQLAGLPLAMLNAQFVGETLQLLAAALRGNVPLGTQEPTKLDSKLKADIDPKDIDRR